MLHLDIDKGNSGQPLREDLNDFNSGSPVTTLVQKLHKLDFVHHVRTGVQENPSLITGIRVAKHIMLEVRRLLPRG